MRDTWNTAIKISDIRTEDRERFASLGIDFSSFSNCYILPGFADDPNGDDGGSSRRFY